MEHNKENTPNLYPSAKPCTKPSLGSTHHHLFQNYKSASNGELGLEGALDEITESIKEITLPR